ncbi:hypothetical protein EDEG_00102 [Edhazardia aedis USNM 41457]|uniref:FACT complex subunit POB3 n=1 Tax=Edhazardia aedis (strain USNM 41457) TaxID=1003232 RepID=J9DUA9_EDHAE|nr:hypothetical protein EDEG_00102 [Edhazardia aedis USNM 41457]|eukprot:EJW04882.1 hypothetical protein EDEG_00102 [Edhazardia aedis USNM 41457]
MNEPMDIIEVEDAYLSDQDEVILRMAAEGIAMKTKKTSQVTTIKREEIREIELFRSTQKFNMRIQTTKNTFFNINNIPDSLVENIKDFIFKHYSITAYVKDLEFEAINQGRLGISGDFLEFKNKEKLIFDIFLQEIKNVHSMKNELTLSFAEKNNSVIEVKFINENPNLIDEIKERLQKSGGLNEEIVTFETLQSVVPRGKNDYIFYTNLFKMVGSTYEHKVLYSSIKNVFMLEKDLNEVFAAIHIDPPIRQGQTRYNFVVLIFNKEELEDFSLKLTEENKLKYPQLKETYSGPVYETFIDVLCHVVSPKTNIIRSTEFRTLSTNKGSLKCSLKAFDGHLYPLENCLLFLPKAIYMPLKEIILVEFSRINVSSFAAKTFDMKVTTVDKSYMFNTIAKEDFGPLEQYFGSKKVKVTSEVVDEGIEDFEGEDEDEDGSEYEDDEDEEEGDEDDYTSE